MSMDEFGVVICEEQKKVLLTAPSRHLASSDPSVAKAKSSIYAKDSKI